MANRTPTSDELEVPFVFVPEGGPLPLDWLARHPGAIRIPATLVMQKAGSGGEHSFALEVSPRVGQDNEPGPYATSFTQVAGEDAREPVEAGILHDANGQVVLNRKSKPMQYPIGFDPKLFIE